MKKILLTLVLSFTTLLSAQAAHPQCGETKLANIMGDMKDDMKAIKVAVRSQDSIKVSAIAQDLLMTVRKADAYVPLSISDKKELTATQQAEYDDYKKGISALEDAVTELTMAKTADEQKAALAKVGKAANKGHKVFKMDCDD